MMRRVAWSDAALRDYLAILRHIAADNPHAAERVSAAMEKAAGDLADFATGHPGRVHGTYEKKLRRLPYIIAYSLSDDDRAVSILRVIHAARDWSEARWPSQD